MTVSDETAAEVWQIHSLNPTPAELPSSLLAEASQGYPCYYPQPLWSEQDPEDWWQATVATIQKVVKKAKLKPADVKAIGLSGQIHSGCPFEARCC